MIRGVTHNIPLLRDILLEDKFLKGDFTTNYLPETYPDGFQGERKRSHTRKKAYRKITLDFLQALT